MQPRPAIMSRPTRIPSLKHMNHDSINRRASITPARPQPPLGVSTNPAHARRQILAPSCAHTPALTALFLELQTPSPGGHTGEQRFIDVCRPQPFGITRAELLLPGCMQPGVYSGSRAVLNVAVCQDGGIEVAPGPFAFMTKPQHNGRALTCTAILQRGDTIQFGSQDGSKNMGTYVVKTPYLELQTSSPAGRVGERGIIDLCSEQPLHRYSIASRHGGSITRFVIMDPDLLPAKADGPNVYSRSRAVVVATVRQDGAIEVKAGPYTKPEPKLNGRTLKHTEILKRGDTIQFGSQGGNLNMGTYIVRAGSPRHVHTHTGTKKRSRDAAGMGGESSDKKRVIAAPAAGKRVPTEEVDSDRGTMSMEAESSPLASLDPDSLLDSEGFPQPAPPTPAPTARHPTSIKLPLSPDTIGVSACVSTSSLARVALPPPWPSHVDAGNTARANSSQGIGGSMHAVVTYSSFKDNATRARLVNTVKAVHKSLPGSVVYIMPSTTSALKDIDELSRDEATDYIIMKIRKNNIFEYLAKLYNDCSVKRVEIIYERAYIKESVREYNGRKECEHGHYNFSEICFHEATHASAAKQ